MGVKQTREQKVLKRMQSFTDTERLDWLIKEIYKGDPIQWNPPVDRFDGKHFKGYWLKNYFDAGYKRISPEADIPHEAIDLALLKAHNRKAKAKQKRLQSF